MTHPTDPFDAHTYRTYHPYSVHLSHERDLSQPDRDIVHTAVHPTPAWRWYDYLTLAALLASVLLGTSHVWWPLLQRGR